MTKTFLNNRLFQLAVLLLIWSAVYLGTISRPALFDDADTVHAEAVREMINSGDWTTLHIDNGIRYLEKAPFMYWMSALSAKAFGLSGWSIRLPIALFTLFLTLLIYRFGCRFWGERTGFCAALVYISSLGPFAFTRIFLPDVMLTFFMTLSLYFYLQVVHEPSAGKRLMGRWDWRAMMIYASCAGAVLTKGLVGIVFVGLIILAHIALTRQWDILKRLQILPGIAVFLLIAAPWHLAAGFANKGFFWFYFINEHFLRYLGLRYPKDYDTVPVWLFWLLHLAWLFPWSVFIWGLARSFPKRLWRTAREDAVSIFPYVWILLVLAFFSFSTTQEYYTFPTLPAIALLFGQVLARIESAEEPSVERKATIGVGVLAVIGVAVGTALLVLAHLGRTSTATGDLSRTLTFNPQDYALSFGHMHDLTPATFARLSTLVTATAALFLAGPLLAFIAAFYSRWRVCFLCMAFFMVGVLHCYHEGMVAFEPILSSKALAEDIASQYQPGDRIVVNAVYEKGSSINFYTHLQLSILNGRNGNLWYGSFYPDAPHIFFDDDSFLKIWNSSQHIFFFSEAAPFHAFLKRHPDFKYREFAQAGGKRVVVNW
jgi:4-amino-4-deoxy-L-arabinose transferase-like glycosyltransferase